MPYYFTVGEANRALPRVRRFIHEIRFWKSKLDEIERLLLISPMDLSEKRKLRTSHVICKSKMREALEKLEEIGCVLRDSELGLVDFPALRFGEVVYLCWRDGEDEVQYWHGLKEGFSGRKPLIPSPEALV